MGGVNEYFEASTITELKKLAQEWAREKRESGFEVHHGWARDKVEKTEAGYRLWVHAHT